MYWTILLDKNGYQVDRHDHRGAIPILRQEGPEDWLYLWNQPDADHREVHFPGRMIGPDGEHLAAPAQNPDIVPVAILCDHLKRWHPLDFSMLQEEIQRGLWSEIPLPSMGQTVTVLPESIIKTGALPKKEKQKLRKEIMGKLMEAAEALRV